MLNPSDPDATYRSKAGESHNGYVGNIVETVGEAGDSLITDVRLEENTHSDSAFCREYLKNRPVNAEPEGIITDGAFGGQTNQQLVEGKNTELITTALSRKVVDPFYAGFRFSEDGTKMRNCPMGHAPLKTTYYPKTGMCRALFPKNCCENCLHKADCKCKSQKKKYAVHASASMASRARYLEKLFTAKYTALTCLRNAIEGIPSVLRRKYHVDEMPAFGKMRSR